MDGTVLVHCHNNNISSPTTPLPQHEVVRLIYFFYYRLLLYIGVLAVVLSLNSTSLSLLIYLKRSYDSIFCTHCLYAFSMQDIIDDKFYDKFIE